MKSNGGFQLVVRVALAAAMSAGAARAQQIDISAGTATDQLGQRSSAVSVAPSVTFAPSDASSVSLAASATRFATGVFSFGGGAALSERAPIGTGDHLAFTADVSANGSRLQGQLPATFAAASILPALELNVSRLTLYGGARASAGYSSLTQPPLVGPARTQSASRTGMGSVAGVLLTASQSASEVVRLGARQEQTTIDGARFTDQSVSLHLDAGGSALDVSGGRRVASDERMTFVSAGLTLPMTNSMALQVGAGRYPGNRLLGTAGGNYLSAGLSIRFGAVGRDADQREIRIAGAPPLARGYTRLSIEARGAREVVVAGDFNNWQAVPVTRGSGDVWYVDLLIPPGQYRYAFRVDGRAWRVPHGATAVNDGFGGQSAWLTVREPGAQSNQ